MFSILLRNLFFTILQPGVVAGLLPWWILKGEGRAIWPATFRLHHYAGTVTWAAGFLIMLSCILRFAFEGKGTLSPADPTKRLVVHGLYRFSRNPMYVGVMLMLIGEAVFFLSPGLWIYLSVIFLAFNIFIIWREEPRLQADFGEEYELYRKKVRRWI